MPCLPWGRHAALAGLRLHCYPSCAPEWWGFSIEGKAQVVCGDRSAGKLDTIRRVPSSFSTRGTMREGLTLLGSNAALVFTAVSVLPQASTYKKKVRRLCKSCTGPFGAHGMASMSLHHMVCNFEGPFVVPQALQWLLALKSLVQRIL